MMSLIGNLSSVDHRHERTFDHIISRSAEATRRGSTHKLDHAIPMPCMDGVDSYPESLKIAGSSVTVRRHENGLIFDDGLHFPSFRNASSTSARELPHSSYPTTHLTI